MFRNIISKLHLKEKLTHSPYIALYKVWLVQNGESGFGEDFKESYW